MLVESTFQLPLSPAATFAVVQVSYDYKEALVVITLFGRRWSKARC